MYRLTQTIKKYQALALFVAVAFITIALPVDFVSAAECPADITGDASSGVCIPGETGLPGGTVASILTNFFTWLLLIFGILAVGAFIISGIQYLVSAGDDKSVATAKMNMKWSVIGVAVGLSGYIILKAVEVALNATNSNF